MPAYWVLGRSRFRGYITARRGEGSEILHFGLQARTMADPFVVPPREARDVGAIQAAVSLADIPVLRGNAVEFLVDGAATFDGILHDIDRARDYVLFQFFIVKDDELGREVQAHLIAKAREGVRVYFLYDEVGSHALPNRYKEELRSAGVQVYAFNTRQGMRNRFQLDFRNHRKIVVVDGREAWIGGHNVGDEYMGREPKFGHWRDTHVRIQGPAALSAQLSFVEDWYWATSQVAEVDWEPHRAPEGDVRALVIPTGPADQLETATLMFIHAINSARERVWIASPYSVPDEAVMAAIHLAGLRGVDVRILIPDHPDHLLVYLAASSYFDESSDTGAEFYRYTDGFLHQKVVLIDHSSASVGTANFDNRSFRLNFEVTATIADSAFVGQVERMFEADFARSRRMEPGELDRKPFWFKPGVSLARLTSPIQ